MSLEVPNLDDRRWADLVEEACALIPRVAPLWTDHNAHDPGITFIELFAWLAEMQIYQLNRVSRKHRELFSELVGVSRRLLQPAQVDIRVTGTLPTGMFMEAGTQLVPLEGQEIIFETRKDVFLTQSRLERLITVDGPNRIDQTQANDMAGIAFLAFGENAEQGAELRLGFDAFYPAREPEIILTARVFTEDLEGRCSANALTAQSEAQEPLGPFVDLVWEYLASGNRWLELECKDETRTFTHNGAITLSVPSDAVQGDVGLFWIRARIREGYYDIEPRLRSISLNVLHCAQVETVRNEELTPVTGCPGQLFTLAKKPILVRDTETRTAITSSDVSNWAQLTKLIEQDHPALADRLINAVSDESGLSEHKRIQELNRSLSVSPGTRKQEDPSATENIAISPEMDHLLGGTPVVIAIDDQPWKAVPSFESSNPGSEHYRLDIESGTVEFGNGLNGLIPTSVQKIRATWYQTSQGRSGNVAKNIRWRFRTAGIPGVELTNPEPASGGSDLEPLDEMELRARALLLRPQRAVTLNDLESLALSTPNAYVARARAITDCPVPESITVVAVPKIRPGRSGPPKPPSRPFLEMVHRHLQGHRLLCDSLRVIGPVYVEVKVSAQLRLLKGAAPQAVIERARQALNRFLVGELAQDDLTPTSKRDAVREPSTQSPCFTRWPFGRRVFPSEAYAILDGVAGVDFASNLVLTASRGGTPIKANASGAIPVPPAGLVYPGQHGLTVETDLRRNG